jgi:hypothetical protein
MSYQLKRINPFWHNHPMIPTAVSIGFILGAMGYKTQKWPLAFLGAGITAIGILAAARPVVSATLGTLGLLGGLMTFIAMPNLQAADMGFAMKLLSSVLFGLFYMVLMDGVVLVVAVLYNLYGGTVGLGGIGLELEGDEDAAEEPAA